MILGTHFPRGRRQPWHGQVLQLVYWRVEHPVVVVADCMVLAVLPSGGVGMEPGSGSAADPRLIMGCVAHLPLWKGGGGWGVGGGCPVQNTSSREQLVGSKW